MAQGSIGAKSKACSPSACSHAVFRAAFADFFTSFSARIVSNEWTRNRSVEAPGPSAMATGRWFSRERYNTGKSVCEGVCLSGGDRQTTKPTEGPKKPGWKNKALAPTFSRFEKSLYLSLHYHTIRFRVSLFLRNLFSLLFRFLPPRTAYSPWLLFVHIPTFSSHFSQISTSS